MAAASSPSGLSPPSGERFFQNTEWLMWPPVWNARSLERRLMLAKSPFSRASASWASALLAPAT